MAQTMREESDTDHRYRITKTDRGYLLSMRQKGELGLMLGPAEWLYRTREAADKGLDLVMLMNAWWAAITKGYPVGDLQRRSETASAAHKQIIEELNDEPLIGEEVRRLRTD